MRALAAIIAAAFLAASSCQTNDLIVDVSGNWNYSATMQSTSPALSCTTTGGAMQLAQSGPAVTGTYSALAFSCTGAITSSFGPFSGNVKTGSMNGNDVSIAFNVTGCCGPGAAWQNTGTSSNSMMQGTTTAVLTLSGTEYAMSGTWSATKQ